MRKANFLLLTAAFTILSMSTMIPAYAHEHREIAEKYEAVVGFAVEPALVNEVNGLDLRINERESKKHVEGLQNTLKAEVVYGGKTMQLELRARFGSPGSYIANFIPTKVGAYTFRIYGTIEGVAVDEEFTSGPNTFSEVRAVTELQFPEKIASPYELQESIAKIQAQFSSINNIQKSIQNLQGGLDGQNSKITQLESSKTKLEENANSANIMAMGGIAVGTIGLVVGAIGTSMAIKARKPVS